MIDFVKNLCFIQFVCVLPLYVRFAGSVCRYLKKWLDMEEMMYPMPVKSSGSKKSRDKKAMKDQAIASRNSKTVFTGPAVDNSTTFSTVQKSSSTAETSKSIPTGQQPTALIPKTNGNSTEKAVDDFSNFYYDMHERKQRKREERKKGKKYEIACQHPCHGKGKGCCSQTGGHDHHHHHHDAPQPSSEQLMACLCEKHRALAEAKIAEKKAALEKHQASGMCRGAKKRTDENSEDKSSGDKSSEDKRSEEKSSEEKSSEEKSSEEKSSEDKISEDKCSEDKISGNKSSEDKTCEDKSSDDKSFESKREKDSERQAAESKDSEVLNTEKKVTERQTTENKDSEGQTSENKDSENKDSEDQTTENKDVEEQLEGNEKSEDNEVKTSEVKRPSGKKSYSHKRIRENGVVSSDSDSDYEEAVERFVLDAFPELHLCQPHPNQQYENMLANEKAKEKLKETKYRTCAFCRKQETEIKTFKKCQK